MRQRGHAGRQRQIRSRRRRLRRGLRWQRLRLWDRLESQSCLMLRALRQWRRQVGRWRWPCSLAGLGPSAAALVRLKRCSSSDAAALLRWHDSLIANGTIRERKLLLPLRGVLWHPVFRAFRWGCRNEQWPLEELALLIAAAVSVAAPEERRAAWFFAAIRDDVLGTVRGAAGSCGGVQALPTHLIFARQWCRAAPPGPAIA